MRVVRLAIPLVVFGALAVPAQADPGDVGYEGVHFSGTGTSVTGAKPESKLWFHDAQWWSVMWDEIAGDNFINRLDQVTQTWANTGVVVDTRSGTRSDVLWTGTKLYVASHGFTNTASAGLAARLYRLSYNATTDTWSVDAGFPVTINNYRTEALVIARDSIGKLWATWVQDGNVYVNRTTGSDLTWGTPLILPAAGATGITTDDISSVVAFGGNKIGVMWSNQTDGTMRFAVHTDGTADTTWASELVLSGPLNADDHINLKAHPDGRVFAATKTSQTEPSAPLTYLLVRASAGGWTSHVFGNKSDNHTRPIVLLDLHSDLVHMFATAPEAGGSIFEKTAPINAIAFEPGRGTSFIHDVSSADVNDATSTKQNLTLATGLVVQASNDTSRVYWHNSKSLSVVKASFTGSPTLGAAPLDVSFVDTSTGDPTSWTWDFGDGGSSTSQLPTHTYTAPGNYSVTLTVANASGAVDTVVRTSYISVVPLTADFSASPTSGGAPLTVNFTDASIGQPTSRSWDFGDGTTSTEQNPSHTYTVPGKYTVSLTLANASETSTKTQVDLVNVVALASNFTATPTSGGGPLTVNFTDTSAGTPTSWSWDFGNGNTSTAQNPSHTYTVPGAYTVSLTVANGVGESSTKTLASFITVSALTADFAGSPTAGPVPLPVSLTDTSIGSPTSWSWDFGDGGTSNEENPTHTYTTPGEYTVTLTVTDDTGATSTKTRARFVIAVIGVVATPSADSHVRSSDLTRNFGKTVLRVRNGDLSGAHWRTYVQFDVTGLTAPVVEAKLRFYVTDGARDGGDVFDVDDAWTELGLTWSNAPLIGGTALGSLGRVTAGGWAEVSLPTSTFAAGNDVYSLAVMSTDPTGGSAYFSNREAGNAAQLILITG